jgi:hypothetical protein
MPRLRYPLSSVMPNIINTTFREAVAARLSNDPEAMLDIVVGSGPAERELARAYRLSGLSMEWAATAVSTQRLGRNGFDGLSLVNSPEQGAQIERMAYSEARNPTNDQSLRVLCLAAAKLGETLKAVDEVASAAHNKPEFICIAQQAATILVELAEICHNDADWICTQANYVFKELIDPCESE